MGEDISKQYVAQMGAETKCHNYFTDQVFGYSESKNGGYFVRARIDSHIKLVAAGTLTRNFEDAVDAMNSDFSNLLKGVTVAIVTAILTIVTGGSGVAVITFALGCIGISSASISGTINLATDYVDEALRATLYWRDMVTI